MMKPMVVDLSHHNKITDLQEVYDSGIRGIIHKATQGTYMVDTTYRNRMIWARENKLLWGAYHFATAEDVEAQVDFFLKNSYWDEKTLLALDYEENPNKGGTMSLAQAKQFMQLVRQKTGQRPVIYSGNLLKEQLKKADPFFSEHRLWLAQYGPKAKTPVGQELLAVAVHGRWYWTGAAYHKWYSVKRH